MKQIFVNVETGEVNEIELSVTEQQELADNAIKSAWQRLRSNRDNLLANSDWTVLSDSPTSTAAWKTYRQALRDLPANTTDPLNPVWPTPPS
jgi:hypothetical protein